MKLDELKRLLEDVACAADDARTSRTVDRCEAQRTLGDVAEMVQAILDRLGAEGLAQEDAGASQIARLVEDFLQWSGGLPPDSISEIFAYCELTLPADRDKEQARQQLKAWMEEAWRAATPEPNDTGAIFIPSCRPRDVP